MSSRKKASDFPKEVLALFDGYVHGHIRRRDFLEGAAKVLGGGAAALDVLEQLRPDYAWARQVRGLIAGARSRPSSTWGERLAAADTERSS